MIRKYGERMNNNSVTGTYKYRILQSRWTCVKIGDGKYEGKAVSGRQTVKKCESSCTGNDWKRPW
jgi:hypothetical protein